MINTRKILLIFLMVAILAGLVFTVWKGFSIGDFEVLGYTNLEEKSEKLDRVIEEYEQKNSTEIPSKQSLLTKSIDEYYVQKTLYEETLQQKQIQLQSINEADYYDIDFIWTKVGNYAKENNLVMELNITKNPLDQGEKQYILANLNFTVYGYININNEYEMYEKYGFLDDNGPFKNTAEFIDDIEDDSTLEFEIREMRMAKDQVNITLNKGVNGAESQQTANILKTTFVVYNVPLNRDTLTVLTSKDVVENQSLTQEGKGDVLNVTPGGSNSSNTTNTQKPDANF